MIKFHLQPAGAIIERCQDKRRGKTEESES
jgi:hypothetical protein